MNTKMLKSLEVGITKVEFDGNTLSVVNTTPHDINLTNIDLTKEEIIKSSVIINAKAIDKKFDKNIGLPSFINLETPEFIPDEDTLETLEKFRKLHPEVIIIGSLIAAQAYREIIVAMKAHPDFMRVAPNQKKMLYNSFVVYKKEIAKDETICGFCGQPFGNGFYCQYCGGN